MPSTITDRLNGLSTSVAVKAPCRVATTANITLSGTQTIDGVAVVAGDRVLVKNQTNAIDNGIWLCGAGTWVRATDFDGSLDVVGGTSVKVNSGASNADTYWEVDGDGEVVIGTDSITIAPTSGNISLQADLASVASSKGGGLVGFSHSSSYAASTVGKKLQQFVNPLDAPYGATGDGVADDRSAIAAADTAAVAAGLPLIITAVHKIASDITIAADIWFIGGSFTASGGAVITYTGETGSSLIEHDDGGAGDVRRSTAAVIRELGHSVKSYGATGDGSTNDYTAFTSTLTRCLATGAPMIIPAGDYAWDLASVGTALWDVTRTVRGAKRAIKIIGMGQGQSSIHISNATSIAWQIASTTDWFDLYLEGLTVYGAMDIPLLVLGKNDYSDPINMVHIKDVSVENSHNGSSNEAVRLNYIAGGMANNLRCNSYSNGSGTNTGTALRLRQVEFMTFLGGSAGNADRGVDFTDGVSFGCTFIGQTYENSDYCFSNRSANSGGHTVIGGQFSNVGTYPIYSSASLGGEPITFIGSNYTPAGALVDPANYSGVRIVHSRSVTTPALPATTVTQTNTSGVPVLVYIWGGTVTAITIDGFAYGITSGTFVLQPGGVISVTYSSAPT